MIERSELDGQLESLERQRAARLASVTEADATLQQIDGAIRAMRHLIDMDSRKVIAARAERDLAEAGGAVLPAAAANGRG